MKLHFNFFVGGVSDDERRDRRVMFTVFVFCD